MGQLLRAGAQNVLVKSCVSYSITLPNDLIRLHGQLPDRGPVRLACASELPHLQDDSHLGEGAQETPSGQSLSKTFGARSMSCHIQL